MALPELIVNSPTPGVQEPIATLAEALTEEGGTVKLSQPMPAGLQGTGQTRLLIDHEIILVEGTASPNVTVITRGAEGTTKAVHAVNTKVYHVPTAEGLRCALAPSLVSALPGSPIDGQEVYYQNTAMGNAGIVWTFRYRAASASIHKWEFVGGPKWVAGPSGSINFAKAEEKALTVGPEITIPITGTYQVGLFMNGQLQKPELQEAWGRICKNGVAENILYRFTTSLTFAFAQTTNEEAMSLAATDVLTVGCKLITAAEFTFGPAAISLLPVLVG